MSGLGGLNKTPDGVVIGLVQLQLPAIAAKSDLAAQTEKICAMVEKAQGHADHGSCGLSRIFAARAVDGYQSRIDVAARRAGSGELPPSLYRQPHLGLLLHHGEVVHNITP